MIRLNRPSPVPEILRTSGSRRAGALKRKYDATPSDYRNGSRKFSFGSSVYGHQTVREVLIAAQHGKCCFCESQFGHIQRSGEVEHFRPKGFVQQEKHSPKQFPGYYWLAYKWTNLLIACRDCNGTYKKNYFPLADPSARARSHHDDIRNEQPLLIDPYSVEPVDHLTFKQELATAQSDTAEGRTTIDILGLNRPKLREFRFLWLKRIIPDIRFVAAEHPSPTRRTEARNFLTKALSPAGQYAAMLRDNGLWKSA